jgi:uncharacterized paraquat-inducible protein A
MKNYFQKINARMQQWMAGRYGMDELSTAMSVVALIALVLSCFPKLRLLYIPTLILWAWSIFRCYSKNLDKRRKERDAYLRIVSRIRSWFGVKKKAWHERKTHRYYRCKQCHAVLRVPKGKGKIKITCPHCHSETIKKT